MCINAFQSFKAWWYTDLTNKIMTPLVTAGLCALMFACFLYRIEKRVFEKVNLYGFVYDAGSSICSLVGSMIPPSDDGPQYRPRTRQRPRRRSRRTHSNRFSWSLRPQDERRNLSGIANQRGRNRYFRNRNGSRAERARARSKSDSEPEEPEEPTPKPTPNPSFTFPFILPEDDFHPEPTLSLPRLPKLRLYYRISEKYWSWYCKHRRRRRKWAPELND